MKRALIVFALTFALALPAFAGSKGTESKSKSHSSTQTTATQANPPSTTRLADNMQLVRDKVRADKKLLVAQNLSLTEAEASQFWPVYEDYQKSLQELNSKTLTVIHDYANAYGTMDDATAKNLLTRSLDLQEERVKLANKYLPKFRKALPEIKVARYYQIENKINAVVSYELASNIPLAE